MNQLRGSRSAILFLGVLFVSLILLAQSAEPAVAALPAPATVTLTTVSTSQIDVSWSAVSGATSYQVYRSTGASTTYTKVATVTARSYKNTGLAAGIKYNYKVRALKSTTPGAFSTVRSAYTKPGTPTGLTAVAASTSQLNLAWATVTGATSYEVWRSVGTSTTYSKITTVTTRTFNNTGLAAGTRYNYKVRALRGSLAGAFALKSAFTKPAAPTGLAAATISTSEIDLSWGAVTGATSYEVWRSIGSSTTYTKLATLATRTYKNTGLAPGNKYNYKVRALIGSLAGGFSTVKSATTKPAAPTGVTAAKLSSTSIRVDWSAVSGATSYKVYVSLNGGSYALKTTITAPTHAYISTSLPAGAYTYQVSAVAGSSEGSRSAATATIPLPTPLLAAPTGFNVTTRNFQSVWIYYNGVPSAIKYRIYHSKTPSSNIADYDYDEYSGSGQPACYVFGLAANTTYYFRVAAVDSYGRPGTPTSYLVAKTSASPGNPPQPKFYVYNMELGSPYRLNFYRSTSPIYPSANDPSFDFYVGTTSTNMTYDGTATMSEYFYYDCPPGQDRWYGFVAKYGPLASTMQKLNVAALDRPTNVWADGLNYLGDVHMSWSPVPYSSGYNIYYAVSYDARAWFDFRQYATYCGTTTGTTAVLKNIPYGEKYFFVVPKSSSGAESWFCGFARSGVWDGS